MPLVTQVSQQQLCIKHGLRRTICLKERLGQHPSPSHSSVTVDELHSWEVKTITDDTKVKRETCAFEIAVCNDQSSPIRPAKADRSAPA